MEELRDIGSTPKSDFGYSKLFAEVYDLIADGYYNYAQLASNLFKLLPNLNKDSVILEIGVGTGNFAFAMYAQGYTNITGIDSSEHMIDLLNAKQADGKKIETVCQDGFNFNISSNSEDNVKQFDLIFSNGGNVVVIDLGNEKFHIEIISDDAANLITQVESVSKHLPNGGYFAINIQKPHGGNHASLDLTGGYQYSNTVVPQKDGILKTHMVQDQNGKIIAQEKSRHIILPWDTTLKTIFLKHNLTVKTIDLVNGWIVFEKNINE